MVEIFFFLYFLAPFPFNSLQPDRPLVVDLPFLSFINSHEYAYCFVARTHIMDRLSFLGRKRRKMLKIMTSTEKNSPSFQISTIEVVLSSLVCSTFLVHQAPVLPKPSPMSPSPNAWLFTNILFLLPLLHTASAAIPIIPINGTCHDTCGTIPVKFPFGTGFGCGHPAFARYIKCSSGTLQFSTGTGIYTISSIDYPSSSVIVTDPLMSTCSSMQMSGSFSLDRASPFTLKQENIFVLLGCSTTSPVFDPNEDLCDTGSGSRVCSGLYSCKGVTGIGLQQNAPTSTCCVYESPMGLGSGYALDLPKLQCSSYTSIYEFGDEGDPMKWKFGISLQYNDTYYTDECKDCEASGGLCGFAGLDESFACICHNGMNTTNNCFGRGYAWSGTWGPKIQTKMTIGGFLLLWILLFIY